MALPHYIPKASTHYLVSQKYCPSLLGRGAAHPPYRGGHEKTPLTINSAALPCGGGAWPTPTYGGGTH